MSVGEFAGMGFAIGVVRGVRSFKVDTLGRLTGVTYEQVWKPGENGAECRKSAGDPFMVTLHANILKYIAGAPQSPARQAYYFGTAPSLPAGTAVEPVIPEQKMMPTATPEPQPHTLETCKCGFYAYYDGSDDYHRKGYVSGVVEGYGETLIGTRGFRAMKARMVALRIPKSVNTHIASLVARNYPDVSLFTSFDDMVTEFPPDGGGAQFTPDSDPDFWTRTI